eukprot:4185547-Pyramimonas_sp.AAC.1
MGFRARGECVEALAEIRGPSNDPVHARLVSGWLADPCLSYMADAVAELSPIAAAIDPDPALVTQARWVRCWGGAAMPGVVIGEVPRTVLKWLPLPLDSAVWFPMSQVRLRKVCRSVSMFFVVAVLR